MLTAIPLVDSDEEVDTAIDAGKLTLYNDGERVVIARGVNSLTTVTEVETADLQKIKINAIQDQIEGDIYSTINKSYIGNYSKGTGSLTMHKVNSRMAIKVANMVRNKQDVRFTLISKLADPDAYGAERVSITGVQMDDLTLFDWEAQKPLETEAPFTFTGYEYLDQITPQ